MVWDVNYYPWDTLTFTPCPRRPGQNGKITYATEIAALDIEATRLPDIEQSIMYVWQLAIDPGNIVIVGRTWGQFKRALWEIKQRLNGLKLLIFVHNLSYEIQFLAGVYHYNDYEVFCTEPRHVLYCTMYKQFELRCSYRLTNLSLDALAKRYNCNWFKRSGVQFDYTKLRYPDTPLDRKELLYAVMDVLALLEAIRAIMALYGDNLYSLPLTQTGFVRREIKAAMYDYHGKIKATWPDYRCYQLLRAAFRGGNTHANRYYAGDILSNVSSVDISSSYPSQQCNKLYPISEFRSRRDLRVSYLHRCINMGKAIVMHVRMTDVTLANPYVSVPYIPIAKCSKLVCDRDYICEDNGRVLRATMLEMCITDIDYKIIVRQYKIGKLEILELYTSNYGQLPQPLIAKNIEYFVAKTRLKGVSGQELYYHKNKELLNSIYGMSVQEVLKTSIDFADLAYTTKVIDDPEAAYMRRQNVAFTSYAYGVWTTAHARDALQHGIDLCGDNLVYVDTDSCKYLGDVDFAQYNSNRIRECVLSGAFADDPTGKRHYMGVYEQEGTYKRFATLGAKKYAYEDSDGELHITVSGVNKKTGAKELQEKGGLEAFVTDGFVFERSGKTEALYNDDNVGIVDYHGKCVDITRNVVIRDVSYTLHMTDDYHNLLLLSDTMLNKIHKQWLNCIVD